MIMVLKRCMKACEILNFRYTFFCGIEVAEYGNEEVR